MPTLADLLLRLGYKQEELEHLTVLCEGSRMALDAPVAGLECIEILIALGGG